MLEQRIQQHFFDSADLKYTAVDVLSRPIHDAAHALLGCITSGGKVLACGSGGAVLLAQHAAAQLVGQFERERPSLAAVALGADAALLNALARSGQGEQVLARQVQALGHPGDLLLAISTGDTAPDVLAAIEAAHDKEMAVIALTGEAGGDLAGVLTDTDVCIAVPNQRAARVLEAQLLVIHCLCDTVDLQLLGDH